MLELPLSVTLTWDHAAIQNHFAVLSEDLDPIYAGLNARIAQVTWKPGGSSRMCMLQIHDDQMSWPSWRRCHCLPHAAM